MQLCLRRDASETPLFVKDRFQSLEIYEKWESLKRGEVAVTSGQLGLMVYLK